jgi:hydrogenase nickel incorporation protein HypB
MEGVRLIEVKEEILGDNDRTASEIRNALQSRGIFMINLMASPGAGKTSLILQTLRSLGKDFRGAIIEGDIDSTVDADRVAGEGVPAVQLRTGGACHLDAFMIRKALAEIDLNAVDYLIIENIGNLVCPAEFDTGAQKRVMILSVPEGDDKPLKYPVMFSVCDVLIVNKMDYMGLSDFDTGRLKERVLKLNPGIRIIEVSCKNGSGIAEWTAWIRDQVADVRKSAGRA